MLKPLSRGFRWAQTPEIVRYDSTDSTYMYLYIVLTNIFKKLLKDFFLKFSKLTFRWIFWMNLIIAVLIAVFVIVPEVLAANREAAGSKGARKDLLRVEKFYAYNFVYLWEFEGALRYSPIFYGYYSKEIMTSAGYRIPLAYFCSMMAVYVFSFAIILKKINQNNKQSKLSEKGDECTFTWKVFASWDYGIANIETAHNKVSIL